MIGRRLVLLVVAATTVSGVVGVPTPVATAAPGVPVRPASTVTAANTVTTASTGAGMSAPAALPGERALAGGSSGFPPLLYVVAADATTVLYASQGYLLPDQGYVRDYFTVPTGGGPVRRLTIAVDKGDLGGRSAGSTYVYQDDAGDTNWIDLDSGLSGAGPSAASGDVEGWESAIPGGGVWVDDSGSGDPLLYSTSTANPEATPTRLAALPDISRGSGAYPLGGTTGVAVVAGTTIDWYSSGTRSVRRLSSAGLGGRHFSCSSVTVAAVGCSSDGRIFRVPTDGSAPSSFPAAHVSQLVVTPALTAWRDTTTGRLVTRSTAGVPRRSSGAVDAVVAAGSGLAASRIAAGTAATPGATTIYRAASAASLTPLTVARSPLVVSTVTLTSGRVAWIDDATPAYPVLSRRLVGRRGGLPLAPVAVLSSQSSALGLSYGSGPDGFVSGLGLSDTRTVVTTGYSLVTGTTPNVVLVDSTGRHVIGHAGDGNVTVSGARVLFEQLAHPGAEAVLLVDLADHRTRNLTSAFGLGTTAVPAPGHYTPLAGVLYGRYVVYEKRGQVFRADLVAGRSGVVGSTSRQASGFADARTAGDWVAWTTVVGGRRRVVYRNARTLGRTYALPGSTLVSVGPSGLVALDAQGRTAFRRWGSPTATLLPAGATVDGPVVAWIDPHGVGEVAPFPAGAARPQALGAPIAAPTVRSGTAWRLDQPASQVLTSCVVVISDPAGRVVARLRCDAAFAAQGEAVATWQAVVGGRRAPAGRYHWQVVAGDPVGSILSSTGTPGAGVQGNLTVAR